MGFVNGKLLALILCAGLLLSLCACGGSTRDYEGEIRLLKEDNVIRITELHNVPNDMIVKFDDKPSLDTIEKSCDLCVSVVG